MVTLLLIIQGIGRKISAMDKESTLMLKEMFTMETGKAMRDTVWAPTSTKCLKS